MNPVAKGFVLGNLIGGPLLLVGAMVYQSGFVAVIGAIITMLAGACWVTIRATADG